MTAARTGGCSCDTAASRSCTSSRVRSSGSGRLGEDEIPHPVYSGETITARGVVTGETRDAEGTRVELEIWVENSSGKMTAAGWASGRVGES